MREYFTYGSVRGAVGNGGPYRVRRVRSQRSRSLSLNGFVALSMGWLLFREWPWYSLAWLL